MNLSVSSTEDLSARIAAASAEHDRHFSGPAGGRQPVHTVYVPADRFSRTTPADFGAEALRLFNNHTPGAGSFGTAFDIDPDLAGTVRERVAAKLAAEPIEDLRIDFEDGYGVRPDSEEDAHVAQVVEAVAAAYQVKGLPHFWGLRVKSFADGGHERTMRTLDGFLTQLRDRLGRLPGGFVITFPKVVMPEHVEIFADYLDRLEDALGLPNGILRFEVQIETTEAIIDHRGTIGVRAIAEAGRGRITAAHFGVYDYTAALGLPPDEQRIEHPACDFARNVMQVALAGTGIRVSDGSCNVVPRNDGPDEVNRTWAAHSAGVRHSLRHGLYQGWDLHPAHLPSRYATVYAFHLAGVDDAIGRVRAWRDQVAGKNGVLEEPATVKALNDRLRRAVDCGALDESVLPD
ncbi:HpcH/HpaI aldolase/citrate lyase family protein [Thermomonospora echinospora]|uniref:HpcH/HpaI aldolase/citrate lyase family protein n=1 Tax=Thermomonospora echinospora TaxID=1992 RepID=A0A1H5SH80_9ACTN|nr:aldolase/citrate lyase family protein [Thermomonospora echinospora]SEF49835.1 HpcH/HpaI aldolase/citrate lyase family protein [Thermomonospora echinospora]